VTNTSLGQDTTLAQLQGQGYEAFYIATGAHGGRRLGIAGEELQGVVQAVDFLRDVNLSPGETRAGRRVAVVGGGNAAIDAARSALRLGAERVYVLYRRTRSEMPAQAEEIEAAQAEGIEFRFLVTPAAIVGDGEKVSAVECQPMELGEYDRSGRRRPIPAQDDPFQIQVDMDVAAISQSPEATDALGDSDVETTAGGLIKIDGNGCTNLPNVFAGGDVCSGPSLAINAIAAGEKGAVAIDQYLNPDETRIYSWRQMRPADVPFDPGAKAVEYGRCQTSELTVAERSAGFREVEGTISADTAVREARRCLRCDCRETEM